VNYVFITAKLLSYPSTSTIFAQWFKAGINSLALSSVRQQRDTIARVTGHLRYIARQSLLRYVLILGAVSHLDMMNMHDYLYEQHEQDAIRTSGALGCFDVALSSYLYILTLYFFIFIFIFFFEFIPFRV
jgi:hypothetical protein